MAIRLSDLEIERLQGLPHFVRSIYIFGIRPYMDYRTGIVGVVRRISWQSIAESVYVEPHQGETDSGTPDKSRVRRAAARLEKAGLVVSQSREKMLIFSCCAADTDKCARNKPDTNPTQTRHSKPDTRNPSSVGGFREEADTNPAHPEHAKPDIPPESVVREELDIDTPLTPHRSRFDEFWAVYPKRVGKKPSREKWKAKQLDRLADRIIADVRERQLKDRKWLDGFIPNPATYLHQERWDDEIELVSPAQPTHGGRAPRPARLSRQQQIEANNRAAADEWIARRRALEGVSGDA